MCKSHKMTENSQVITLIRKITAAPCHGRLAFNQLHEHTLKEACDQKRSNKPKNNKIQIQTVADDLL